MSKVRCAIYTRKSSEEGLDQAFNSLEAQREAGLDYIRSQKHEGWTAVPTRYDDGGFSGGTMRRPALERLLADIGRGRVDVVVVYKVDRLSRSLGDFAEMMRLFDDRGVSFVSVTQQFNTTNSMGRLTLNMLLSFAQFEREVAGERIRDKIAATKKQGYWVCGQPPLGYRLQTPDEQRGLYIVQQEARTVRRIFELFIGSGSLVSVAERLNADGVTTKKWESSNGKTHGGKPLTPKYLRGILMNPIYIGKIRHSVAEQTTLYDGRHEPIIAGEQWEAAQQMFTTQDGNNRHRWTHGHLLKGKLRTHEGHAMSPSAVHRPGGERKRIVPYYVSQKAMRQGFASCELKTVNARELDGLVGRMVLDHVDDRRLLALPDDERRHWIRELINRVVLSPDAIVVEVRHASMERLKYASLAEPSTDEDSESPWKQAPKVVDRGDRTELRLPISIKKRDGRRLVLSPDGEDLVVAQAEGPRAEIVEAIGHAYRWHDDLLGSGESIAAYAKREEVSESRMHKVLPLVQLGPVVLRAALTGSLPPRVTLRDLAAAARDLDWRRQLRYLGMSENTAG